jgi:hypothetical protein
MNNSRKQAAARWNAQADAAEQAARNWRRVARNWKAGDAAQVKAVRAEARRRAKAADADVVRCRNAARSWAS